MNIWKCGPKLNCLPNLVLGFVSSAYHPYKQGKGERGAERGEEGAGRERKEGGGREGRDRERTSGSLLALGP